MADEIRMDMPNFETHLHFDISGQDELRKVLERVAELEASLDKARAESQSLNDELSRVNSQFEDFAHNNGVDILTEEVNTLRAKVNELSEQALYEFRNILQSMNINPSDLRFDDLFNEIETQVKNGEITASQAVMRFKSTFRSLIEESYEKSGGLLDTQMIQEFTASLEKLANTVQTVVDRLNNIEQNGVKAVGGSGGGDVANVLSQIENAARGMSEEVKGSYESITSLVNAMNEYANLDSTRILGVSQAFRNIADIGKGSYGTKSIENIVYLTKQLQALSASGSSIRFDFTGFNDLKVSKASVNNLATYLPKIAKIDAAKLEALSKINLTNFNNIKVSKSSAEGILSLADAFRQLKEVMSAYTDTAKQVASAEENAKKRKESSKTVGKEVSTYRENISKMIRDMRTLRDNNASSGAIIDFDGDNMKAVEAIDVLIDRLRVYNGELTEESDMQRAFGESFDRSSVSVLSAETSMKSYQDTMRLYNAIIANIKSALKAENDERRRYSKADKESLKDANALSKAIVATNRAYKQATEALQKYTAAKNGKSSKQYADIEREAASLKSLEERLHNGTISQQEYIKATNKSRAVIQEATAIIKANGEAHLSLGDKIKVTAEKFSQYFGIAKVVNLAWRATRQMVQATIELDDAFTQLKIVTGATDSEMEKFSDTAIKLSKSLGQSVADVTKSIETFSRLGYNLPDASKLAEYATILANTAAVSTDEATTGLTSIIKGFQLNVEDAEHVSDVLIQVGQKYAVSAGELMEAFERSGAALNATNVSFEKAAGLIAAANASVQDSSTVGTALKTVSARIRGSKSELEELGEDTTDLAEGFSKYAKELQALTGFNIMVEGSTTEFKDLFDIMQGISEVWDDLSDTSRARVSEILGGTRQLQVISSIIGNWKDASGAYADAMDSAGVATKANDTYMESATAHINQFKASFEELSSDILSSKLLGGIIDAGSTILGILDSISKLLGGLPGDLTGLAVAISAALSFKNVGELINQFQFLIILRIEYAHEAFN